MRPSSAYNTNRLSESSSKRPYSSFCKSRVNAWNPIIIESIPTINTISKGTIADIERDVHIDDKINLAFRNLFNTLSLPHDRINSLNYSNNYISKIEKLTNLVFLQYLDFSDNHIEQVYGLPQVPCLKVLMLGRNRIQRISGLDAHVNLQVLDLASNAIQELAGLEKLQSLRVLNLESNQIKRLPDISYLLSLEDLNLKKNQITLVSPISLTLLKRLLLANNLLDDVQVVSNFVNCSQLLELYVEGNPFAGDATYRTTIIVRLKFLKFLDGKRINEEERRICTRLEKRASDKRIEAQKILQRDNEKKSILDNIEKCWVNSKKEIFIYPFPTSKKNNSKSFGAFKKPIAKSQVYDGGFYKMNNGCLEM
jgi:hypothetical protein